MPTRIYGLHDPADDKPYVVYVGKTVMCPPHRRLVGHIYKAKTGRTKSPVGDWIRELLADGDRPKLVVLEVVPDGEDWQEAERRWISALPNLLNGSPGGEGSTTRRPFPSRYRKLLGQKTDVEVGKIVGLSRECVGYHRRKMGITAAPFDRSHSFDHLAGKTPHNKIKFPKYVLSRLGKVSDNILAEEVGCSKPTIGNCRRSLNISPCPPKMRTGFEHHAVKITQDMLNNVRAEYIPYRVSLPSLGEKYGVSVDTIRRIVNYETFLDRDKKC
jgi:hypothetical protein